MGEYHRFRVDIAIKYGVPCALVLGHINHMIQAAEDHGEAQRDGKYWMQKSAREFGETYPYLTKSQIRHALERLRRDGLVQARHFRTNECTKTYWYTLTPEAKEMLTDVSPETHRSVTDSTPERQKQHTGTSENAHPMSPETHRSVKKRISTIEVNSSLNSSLVDDFNKEYEEDARARGDDTGWVGFVRAYQNNIGLLPTSTVEREDLTMFFEEYGPEALGEFIAYTARKHPDNPHRYFAQMCRKYLGNGIKSAEQAKAAFMDYERRKGGVKDGEHRGAAVEAVQLGDGIVL